MFLMRHKFVLKMMSCWYIHLLFCSYFIAWAIINKCSRRVYFGIALALKSPPLRINTLCTFCHRAQRRIYNIFVVDIHIGYMRYRVAWYEYVSARRRVGSRFGIGVAQHTKFLLRPTWKILKWHIYIYVYVYAMVLRVWGWPYFGPAKQFDKYIEPRTSKRFFFSYIKVSCEIYFFVKCLLDIDSRANIFLYCCLHDDNGGSVYLIGS